jgi:DNA-binding NarL/FixJ family response regulator
MKKISVLITDDHKMVRESIAALLTADDRFLVEAQCGSGEEAIRVVSSVNPDIILMDINLPGMNGMQTAAKIKELLPAVKIVGMSMHSNLAYVKQMFRAGVMGYVTKNSGGEEVMKAITEVMANRRYVCNEVKSILSANMLEEDSEVPVSLSPRETQLISFLQKGYTSRDIASQLELSVKTIEAHRYNILKKLKLVNVAALINYVHNQPLPY